MLELSQILAEIQDMGAVTRRRAELAGDQLAKAIEIVNMDPGAWALAKPQIESRKDAGWLIAGLGDDAPNVVRSLPYPAPKVYTAIATDGSQIALDRHAAAQCYLLNTGLIVFHYGVDDRPTLTAHAKLFYKDEDIFPGDADDPSDVEMEMGIQAQRTMAESRMMTALIAGNADRHAVAMMDNPLIVWTERGQKDEAIKAFVLRFCEMFDVACEKRMPLVGYVSAPGHKDVVGALRSTLCPSGCRHGRTDACSELSTLTDAYLFGRILGNPGDRSCLFRSRARSAEHYPKVHEIWFFYLNAGDEIARVEVPKWVADDPALLNRAHVLSYDQSVKGQGYPVALAEAHNQAVVRGPERAAFFNLVEQSFAHQRIPVRQTRKAMAKRVGLL